MTADRMISFAQNGEDVVLRRAFAHQAMGFYIDIGANHPVWDSVTKHFYDAGWHGINIEPLPSMHAELVADRPRDVNLNVGISDEAGTMVLNEVPSASGLSTFNPQLSEYYVGSGRELVARAVEVLRLQDVVDQHVSGPVDFLKVDVEGHERAVLTSVDWQSFRPRAMVVEATYPERWANVLVEAEYELVQFDGINNFYVAREERDQLGVALATPATVLDAFDPYHYVHQLAVASAEIELLRQRVAALEADGASPRQAGTGALAAPADWARRTRRELAARWQRVRHTRVG